MSTLFTLKPAAGSRKKKKREGRGHAGYGGKTAGKGMNGQKARKSAGVRKQFEGGQTPLYRRLPKKQYIRSGVNNTFTIINISDIEKLGLDEINAEILLEKKIIKKLENGGLKVLGNGEISKAVKITANAYSASAKEKIEKAKGSIELVAEKSAA